MNDEQLLYATLVNFSSFISYKTLYQLSTSYTVYMVYIYLYIYIYIHIYIYICVCVKYMNFNKLISLKNTA